MPVFKIEVFKQFFGENWGNVYHVVATDLDNAAAAVPIIVEHEQTLHSNIINFTNARVADTVPGTDIFRDIAINELGARNDGGELLLPLYDTLRVDLNVAAGRPGRKYYRGCLNAADLVDNQGSLSATRITGTNGLMSDLISDLGGSTPLCQPDGDVIVGAATFGSAQMRQLHRKRRKPAATP